MYAAEEKTGIGKEWHNSASNVVCYIVYSRKSVYAAEEKIGAGKKWHKFCLKCVRCPGEN